MRICTVWNCGQPVFGTDKETGLGYCQRHQWKRTDRKAKPLQKPEKQYSFGYQNEITMFQSLWVDARNESGLIICKYTGERLERFRNSKLWFQCFAHVLPKGRYAYFKLNPQNVKVVFPEFHRIVDQGTFADRAKHPDWRFDLWDQEAERMKTEYEKFKKENLLA